MLELLLRRQHLAKQDVGAPQPAPLHDEQVNGCDIEDGSFSGLGWTLSLGWIRQGKPTPVSDFDTCLLEVEFISRSEVASPDAFTIGSNHRNVRAAWKRCHIDQRRGRGVCYAAGRRGGGHAQKDTILFTWFARRSKALFCNSTFAQGNHTSERSHMHGSSL
eukprot:365522-Chlamydomonas_euryale.AAC.8